MPALASARAQACAETGEPTAGAAYATAPTPAHAQRLATILAPLATRLISVP